ncbi:MAG: hypothetical protein DBP02_05490 [gamma proteobacterium symbiont of Ctena orbiculata]|nr:MAG: hypothetical protein DBP02_05490 [gamma proteobacterium symbiont of Ctena orbiculata]
MLNMPIGVISPRMNANKRKYLKRDVGCGLPHRPGFLVPTQEHGNQENERKSTQMFKKRCRVRLAAPIGISRSHAGAWEPGKMKTLAFISVHLRTAFIPTYYGVER